MEKKINSKQRAYLKSLAMKTDACIHIGKAAVTPDITQAVDEALEARELIKIAVLKNCVADITEMAHILFERTHSVIVQIIGRKIVLYRESASKKRIELPKNKN